MTNNNLIINVQSEVLTIPSKDFYGIIALAFVGAGAVLYGGIKATKKVALWTKDKIEDWANNEDE